MTRAALCTFYNSQHIKKFDVADESVEDRERAINLLVNLLLIIKPKLMVFANEICGFDVYFDS